MPGTDPIHLSCDARWIPGSVEFEMDFAFFQRHRSGMIITHDVNQGTGGIQTMKFLSRAAASSPFQTITRGGWWLPPAGPS